MTNPRFRVEIDGDCVTRWRRGWFGRWKQVGRIRQPEIQRILGEIADAIAVDDIHVWLVGPAGQFGASEDDAGFAALCDWIDREFALAGTGWREDMTARAIKRPLTPDLWQIWGATDGEAGLASGSPHG